MGRTDRRYDRKQKVPAKCELHEKPLIWNRKGTAAIRSKRGCQELPGVQENEGEGKDKQSAVFTANVTDQTNETKTTIK